MHILMIPSWYATAAKPNAGLFFRRHAEALAMLGNQVGIAFYEGSSLRKLPAWIAKGFQVGKSDHVQDGFPTARVNGINPLAQTALGGQLWGMLAQKAVRLYVKSHGTPDVVYAESGIWGGVAAERSGLPFALTEHSSLLLSGGLSPLMQTFYRRMAAKAVGVSAVSSVLAHAVSKLTMIDTVAVTPNCIDVDFWRTHQQRSRTRNRFVAVGNLTPVKGFDVLLQAFSLVHKEQPGTSLTIVGSGTSAETLKFLARSFDVPASFEGAVSPERLREILWNSDCFVCSSRFETFGVAVVEALASGLPVISTECGGPEEFLKPEFALLVEKDNAEQLAAKMVAFAKGEVSLTPEAASVTVSSFSRSAVGPQLQSLLTHGSLQRAPKDVGAI